MLFFFFQAEDGIRDIGVTGVQTCALPIAPDIVDHLEVSAHILLGSGLYQGRVIIGSEVDKHDVGLATVGEIVGLTDRKSTRLNSSHANISYAVFCLKKKKKEVNN